MGHAIPKREQLSAEIASLRSVCEATYQNSLESGQEVPHNFTADGLYEKVREFAVAAFEAAEQIRRDRRLEYLRGDYTPGLFLKQYYTRYAYQDSIQDYLEKLPTGKCLAKYLARGHVEEEKTKTILDHVREALDPFTLIGPDRYTPTRDGFGR